MSANPASSPAPTQPAATPMDGILGLLNVFIDPVSTARRVQLKWFWIYPLIVISAVTIFVQLQMSQFQSHLKLNVPNAPPPPSPTVVGQIVSACTSVLFLVGILALVSLLVLAFSAIVDARARYKHIFTMLLTMGMISSLQQIATLIVARANSDDIRTLRDLMMPSLGLDIFIHTQGVLASILAFFSIFQIWLIVMTGLTFSHLAKASKAKAFFATCPGWIIGLLFYIGIGVVSDKFYG